MGVFLCQCVAQLLQVRRGRGIGKFIRGHDLNRVVVSCTSRTNKPLFMQACEEAGLN